MARSELISVLLPAFKPEFMRETLNSVLSQTHTNMEVLVGDNSGDPEILQIIYEFSDPRVIYIPSHQVTGGSVHINHMLLWWRAKGRYLRYVYDDDIIYTRSNEVLLELITHIQGAAMSWHQRDVIDADSHVISRQNFLGDKTMAIMDRSTLLFNLTCFMNFIGEPSFVMFDKKINKNFNFNYYNGFELRFLWDVGAYLESAKTGCAVGSAEVLGGFRRHENQISATVKQNFIFGCVEWELVFRNELAMGLLTNELAYSTLPRIAMLYKTYEAILPALRTFREHLEFDLASHRLAEETPSFNGRYRELTLNHHQ